MENLNDDQIENQSAQNEAQGSETGRAEQAYTSDGLVSQNGSAGEAERTGLEEQKEGSDADQDESTATESDDLEEQIKGSDSDYDNQALSASDLGLLRDQDSGNEGDEAEVNPGQGEGDEESDENFPTNQ